MTVMWPSGFPKSLHFLLLVMMSLVGSAIAERSCPLGKFCRIGANCSSSSSQCVETCPTDSERFQQGNWSTGNCERIPNGTQYWMDSTLYELFILPNVTGEFKDLLFIMSYEFQRSHDNYDYLDDITFHLYPSDNPYFYFGNGDTTHAAFQDYYDLYLPDITEWCSLSSATSDPIPLDDYELQVAVSAEGTELLRRDIIIHVVNQLPSSPTHAGTYVSFSQSKYSVVEDDRQVRPVLVLSNSSSTNITVQVRSNDITATGGVDYDSGPYTVTFPAGVTSVACDIPIRDDNIMEDDETFTLTIMDGSLPDDVARGTYGQARITIVDYDKITVSFSQSTYSVDEDDGPARPVLVLSNPSSTDITVQVRSNDITATEGVDYDSGPYTVIFPAGVTSVSFGVPINDDNSMENDESFTLTIMGHSLPDDVTRGTPGRTRITIVDNDTIIVSFNQSTYSVDEDDGPAQPVLVLSNPSSTDITVQVRSNDITATGGVDYDSGPYTVTFPAGVTSVSFNIPIVDNNTIENDESFTLTIMDGSLPDDVTRGTPGLARITIVDDDTNSQCSFQSCPTRNVQLTEGDQPVTLPCDFNTPINSSSTATGSYTYCYNSTILVPHSSNSYTIDSIDYTLDNSKICCFDNEAQSCAVCYNFSVYYKPRNKFKFLQGPTPVFGEQYTINCEVIANPSPVCEWRRTMFQLSDVDNDDDGSSDDNGSSSSTGLVFPSIKIVDFPIPSEAIFTNNNCTITFNILKPNHKGDYSCTATNFLGTAHASIPTITFTSINVSFNRSTYSVHEDYRRAQPVLVLSNPSSTDITVLVTSNDITATGGVDYNSGPYIITFPAGVTSVSFDVPIYHDNIMEDNERFTLTIMDGSLPDHVTRGTTGQARITIVDNDSIYVSFNQSTYSVDEDDGPAQPVLVLSNPSSTTVIVQVLTTNGTATEDDDYDPGPYTVMIPAGMTSASFDIDISNSSITSECVKNFSLTIIDRPFHHWRYRPDYHWIYKEYYWKYGPDYHWRHKPEYYWKYGPDYYWRHRPEYYWKYGPDYYWKIRKGYPSKAVVNIVGDCDTAIAISFSQWTYSVDEDDGLAQPVLVLSNPSSTDITVQVRSNDITATEGVDYDSGPYTVTFPAGVTSVSFDVPIIDDNILEGNKKILLSIVKSSLPKYVSFSKTTYLSRVDIVDDDSITVSFNQSTYSVNENDGPAQPVLVLSNPSSTDITVLLFNVDGSAIGGVDYDSGPYTVTFPAGVTSVPFDVPIIDDDALEKRETFYIIIVRLSLPKGISCGTTCRSRVTIINDDYIIISFNKSKYIVDEDSKVIKPVLVLSKPSSSEISVQVNDISVTATGGDDYSSGPYNVTFPAGVTSVPFDVPIIDDDKPENREVFRILVVVDSLPTGVSRGQPASAIVTIGG